ncbi:unnamed protein product [Lasius platythorax]|uniref:Uncharacterized protein n=1 Tax=Lasius platythorax TaxID=488582 RepID=A0AAV2NME7_9HYME
MVRFPPASSCTKESPVSTCAWESSSLFEQEISEPNTTSRAQGDIGSSQLPKVLKPEEKLNKIKGWIKKHVEISHQLDKAAKRVLQKNKDIGEVAHKHKLDLWMLNKKVHIIKFRKTQFDIKRDHEDAVNAVKFNILSVSSAAKEYGVDKDFIHDKLKKLKYLNSNVYVHDEKPKTDDTVLEWDEEFLLLNNLQRQVSDDPNCVCRSCALQKLPSLAYEFVEQNKRPYYPSAWNTTGKADVIWTCEFIMRHSREISNYFQKECMADLVSKRTHRRNL